MNSVALCFVMFVLTMLWAPWSLAQERDREPCPQKLSMPAMTAVEQRFVSTLRAFYRELGCEPEVLSLPGRRSIHQFNQGKVDGELFRAAVVEAHYRRPFVRSAQPLFHMSLGICSRPGYGYAPGALLGYVRGVVWHENYVAPYRDSYRTERVFDTQDQLYQAYNAGEVDHFLCEGAVLDVSEELGKFDQPPALIEVLQREPIYHYLDQRFAPFMQRFSAALERNNPFARFD